MQNRLRLARREQGQAPFRATLPPVPNWDSLRARLELGMKVVGLNDNEVGQVKEVREGDLLVDRPFARDVYVPFTAIREVSRHQASLTVPANAVDNMGWEHPAVLETAPPLVGTMRAKGE